jgi:O-6-methylguanine DNA methyltransferase
MFLSKEQITIPALQEALKKYSVDLTKDLSEKTIIKISILKTPTGEMLFGATDKNLVILEFGYRRMMSKLLDRVAKKLNGVFVLGENEIITSTKKQLEEYFNGERKEFTVPLEFTGTEFQNKVWNALIQIPYGETHSYLQLSQQLGNPLAIRAVARANGENCLAIIVPCHRIIGSNGEMIGYGGGIQRKKFLLNLEKKYALKEEQIELNF